MSDNQVQDANAPASNGTNIEELNKRLADLERANRGLLEDTKAERRRRQEMEEELSTVRTSLSSAASQTDVNPQVDQVWNQYFAPKVNEVVKPLAAANEYLSRKDQYRDALDWLADQEDSRPSKIKGSKLEKELEEIAKENNLVGMDIFNGTRAAYQIYQAKKAAEKKAKEAAETKREEAISNQTTETVTNTAPVSSSKKWTASAIAELSEADYNKHRQAIMDAYASGNVVNDIKRRSE